MNLYITPTSLRTLIGTSSSEDANLLEIIKGVSRAIDKYCHRFFYTEVAEKQSLAETVEYVFIPDLLSVTTLSVSTRSTGSTTELDITDYVLYPLNKFPKMQLKGQPWSGVLFVVPSFVVIDGVWGYGDGLSASPWDTSFDTVTLAIDDTTEVVGSVSGYEVGQTLLIGSTEQIYITAIDTGFLTLTFKRAVNGTTASAYTDATVQTALYPEELIRIVSEASNRIYKNRKKAGVIVGEKIGDYSYALDKGSGTNSGAGVGFVLNEIEKQSLRDCGLRRIRF